jgi:tetratricopeptide (TPR) repeat protein
VTPLLAVLVAIAPPGPTEEAERLAAHALAQAASHPEAGLVEARKALALTEEFEPTVFVKAGRKGEVVEDAYLAAREEYRRHRARLYEAVGECLGKGGQPEAAVRYFGRAVLLDRTGTALPRLARALVAAGKGRAALDLLGRPEAHPTASDLEAAADAAEVPSAQAEMDRIRLLAAGLAFRDGPFALPSGVRLSTGGPLVLAEPGTTVLYVAEASCKTCSEDLLLLKGVARPGVRVVLYSEAPTRDQALREVVSIYRLPFPLLVGDGILQSLRLTPRSILLVSRGAWAGVELKAPFPGLEAALKIFATEDIKETLPRAGWNHRAVDRRALPPPPSLLKEGLAPGEDAPPPEEFMKAVEAFRGGRPRDALVLFDALAARGDGWLLPPEARFDRALCLSQSGQKDAARKMLLKTGDSRFQDAVDHALESVGTP